MESPLPELRLLSGTCCYFIVKEEEKSQTNYSNKQFDNKNRIYERSNTYEVSYHISIITLSWIIAKKGLNDPPSWFFVKYLATGANPYNLWEWPSWIFLVDTEQVRIEWLASRQRLRSSRIWATGLFCVGNWATISEAESKASGPAFSIISNTPSSIAAFKTRGSTDALESCIAYWRW